MLDEPNYSVLYDLRLGMSELAKGLAVVLSPLDDKKLKAFAAENMRKLFDEYPFPETERVKWSLQTSFRTFVPLQGSARVTPPKKRARPNSFDLDMRVEPKLLARIPRFIRAIEPGGADASFARAIETIRYVEDHEYGHLITMAILARPIIGQHFVKSWMALTDNRPDPRGNKTLRDELLRAFDDQPECFRLHRDLSCMEVLADLFAAGKNGSQNSYALWMVNQARALLPLLASEQPDWDLPNKHWMLQTSRYGPIRYSSPRVFAKVGEPIIMENWFERFHYILETDAGARVTVEPISAVIEMDGRRVELELSERTVEATVGFPLFIEGNATPEFGIVTAGKCFTIRQWEEKNWLESHELTLEPNGASDNWFFKN